ncbi:MAG: hypothetical protein JSR67_10570 [Proteobacteria bacterium]|nr:hypothetical protein [Pseudomonadota bacterium]
MHAISAIPQAPHQRATQVHTPVFVAVLLYYWAYLYVRVLLPAPEDSALAYGFTAIPVAAVAAGAVLLGIAGSLANRLTLLLWVFVLVAVAVSAPRNDLATVRSAGLLGITLIWLSSTRSDVSVRLLNGFFAASIVAGSLWYLFGLSDYGLLPGQNVTGVDTGLAWRVSLFPFVPESAFLSLIVFLANQLQSRGLSRLIWCSLSLYFLVFGGVRSALLALILCEAYVLLNAHTFSARRRGLCLFLLLVVFVIAIAAITLVTLLPALREGALGNYLFRTETVGESDEGLEKTVYRPWLWLQHFDLFMSSPLTGIGTFELSSVMTSNTTAGSGDTGAEAFITGWLARLGLCFLPFILYLVLLGRRAAKSLDLVPGSLFLILGVACLAYGSFLVPYNFIFLILFRLLLQRRSPGSATGRTKEIAPTMPRGNR